MSLQLVVIAFTVILLIPGSDACFDVYPAQCRYWASIGECRRNPRYMEIYCKKSCGLCPTHVRGCQGCWDYNTRCSEWASRGECRRNPAYMLRYCRFSCKVCTCSTPPTPPTPPPIPTTQRPKPVTTPPKPTTDWPSPPPPKPETGLPPIPTKVLPSPPMPTTEGPMPPLPQTTTAPPVPPITGTTTGPVPSTAGPTAGPVTQEPVTTTGPVPSTPGNTTGHVSTMPGSTARPVTEVPGTTSGPVPSMPGTTVEPFTKKPGTTVASTLPPIPGTTIQPTPVCQNPLPVGIAKETFPREAFKASSSESQWHQPEEGRLNNQESDESVGAWCAALLDDKQYIQIDLGEMRNITAIFSQGRDSELQKYVTKYKVNYSKDGTSWKSYKDESDPTEDKVFEGNDDNTSIKVNKLKKFVLAKHLRIRPVEWKNMICMRLEFEYCADK